MTQESTLVTDHYPLGCWVKYRNYYPRLVIGIRENVIDTLTPNETGVSYIVLGDPADKPILLNWPRLDLTRPVFQRWILWYRASQYDWHPFPCVCCGYPNMGAYGTDDIADPLECTICGWEYYYDNEDASDFVFLESFWWDGNYGMFGYSLEQARRNFEYYGAVFFPSDPRFGRWMQKAEGRTCLKEMFNRMFELGLMKNEQAWRDVKRLAYELNDVYYDERGVPHPNKPPGGIGRGN